MARAIARGDVWSYRFRSPDKQRPVVVLSRDEAIDVLATVLVAPVTSTIRGLPSEVVVGRAEGLEHESAVNLDHVQCVDKSRLVRRVGKLATDRMADVCAALAVSLGCD